MSEVETVSSSPSYPQKRKITLYLELEVKDEEQDSYIFAEGSAESNNSSNPTLQIGFIADLFDLFTYETGLTVEKINSFTHEQVTRTLQSGI